MVSTLKECIGGIEKGLKQVGAKFSGSKKEAFEIW